MSLTGNITTAIATDTAIAAWCSSAYGRVQTVQLGVDLDRLPEQDLYPIVVVSPLSSREGRALDLESADYVVSCGIVDDAGPVTSGRTVIFNQVADLEDFRRLVLTAIEGADLAGGYVAEVEVENDPVELFPIFSTNMIVKIHCPTSMRGRWVK
jgi:hypothetical protein